MVLEIENILRNIREIRAQILSLEARYLTEDQVSIARDIKEQSDDLQYHVRRLQFELNGGNKGVQPDNGDDRNSG